MVKTMSEEKQADKLDAFMNPDNEQFEGPPGLEQDNPGLSNSEQFPNEFELKPFKEV
jgi:hypothetical protein